DLIKRKTQPVHSNAKGDIRENLKPQLLPSRDPKKKRKRNATGHRKGKRSSFTILIIPSIPTTSKKSSTMPHYRITLISNSNQTLKPLLLFAYLPTRAAIIARAKQKFRTKTTRLFLPGGDELLTDADVTAWLITPPDRHGLQLLSSGGEEYVGARAKPEE